MNFFASGICEGAEQSNSKKAAEELLKFDINSPNKPANWNELQQKVNQLCNLFEKAIPYIKKAQHQSKYNHQLISLMKKIINLLKTTPFNKSGHIKIIFDKTKSTYYLDNYEKFFTNKLTVTKITAQNYREISYRLIALKEAIRFWAEEKTFPQQISDLEQKKNAISEQLQLLSASIQNRTKNIDTLRGALALA